MCQVLELRKVLYENHPYKDTVKSWKVTVELQEDGTERQLASKKLRGSFLALRKRTNNVLFLQRVSLYIRNKSRHIVRTRRTYSALNGALK
jgi:hypothetical protein